MNAKQRLCIDLGLPSGDAVTQDWAYELPEEYRTRAWLQKYIRAYETSTYSTDVRTLLMDLILDVTNDLVQSGNTELEEIWTTISEIIRAAPDLHRGQLEYWAGEEDEPLEDSFAIARWARELRSSL